MHKILLATDFHLLGPEGRIIGLDPAARARTVLAHAAANHPDAQALVLCGDLTDHGTPEEYDQLRDVLAGLPWPVIPMLGNHDRRDAFCAAFPEAAVTPDGHVMSAHRVGGTLLVTLDTLVGPPFGWTHLGRLCPARRAWLEEVLTEAGESPVLLFSHHPAAPVGMAGLDLIRLEDGDWLIDLLADHPGPAHLVHGHVHRTVSGQYRGVPFTIFKGTCHQTPLDLDLPNAHAPVDEPGVYGVILLTEDGIVCHSQDVPSFQ